MKRNLLVFSAMAALLFPASGVLAQDGKVVEKDTDVIEQEAGKIGGTSVEKGETSVKIKERQRVTRTLIEKEQIPTAKICEERADINRMNEKDFSALGFDQKTAKQIIQTRKQKGGFQSVDELAQVQGIDQSKLQELEPNLTAAKKTG